MREFCTMTTFLNNGFVKWLLVPLVVLGLLGWYAIHRLNAPFPVCTFRYKLTAEVMTPDGLKTGSSVIEVSYSHHGDYGGGENAVLNIVGEAVYVDLGAGKNLFVTLTTRDSGRAGPNDRNSRNFEGDAGPMNPFAIPLKVYGIVWHFGKEVELCLSLNSIDRSHAQDVPIENFPTLASFSDLKNPNSVRILHPEKFSAIFGDGFNLLKLSIQPSKEAQVPVVENLLPWLRKMRDDMGTTLSHSILDPTIDQLNYYAFKITDIHGAGGFL
jgi:hypothetical protein